MRFNPKDNSSLENCMFGVHLLKTKYLLAMCHEAQSRIAKACSTRAKEKIKKPLSKYNTSNNPRDPRILLVIDFTTRNGSF